MGFRRSDLQPAFAVPGDHRFTVWGYGTTDTLDEVLGPRYVRAGRSMLSLGDLIYVRTLPRRERPHEPERGEIRAALVMVSGWTLQGDATLRLVQDFGRPDDPGAKLHAGPPAPASKKPAAPGAAESAPPGRKDPAVSAEKARPASAKKHPATPPRSARRAPEPTPEPPPRPASRSPDPSPAPPVRKRGRPPKNRARLGG